MKLFAKHILAIANETKKITNLQLQKIMYFSIGEYIAENGIDETIKNLYNMPFEATLYGPLVSIVYLEYKKYGRTKIKEVGAYVKKYEKFNGFINKHIQRNGFEMIRDSQTRTTYLKYQYTIRNEKRKIVYKLDDLQSDFI